MPALRSSSAGQSAFGPQNTGQQWGVNKTKESRSPLPPLLPTKMTSTTTTTSTYNTTTRHTLSRRPLRSGIATASTPNLNQLYTSQTSRLLPPALARKGSVAALTQNSLASIPDDSEGYAYKAYNSDLNSDTMPPMPHTPGRFGGGDEVTIGDTVDVPGNMTGTVRFIGSVAGRKGNFAGVELHPDYAPRGKNNGDVDG